MVALPASTVVTLSAANSGPIFYNQHILFERVLMSELELKWEDDATALLGKVPIFVRKMVKGKIEKAARAANEEIITVAFMDKLKKEQG